MMLYHLLSQTDREIFQPVVISLIDRGTLGDRIQELNVPLYTLELNIGKHSITIIPKLLKSTDYGANWVEISMSGLDELYEIKYYTEVKLS